MKKQLLLSGIVAFGLSAYATEVPAPKVFEDAFIQSISSNGVYAVSQTQAGVRIFNLVSNEEFDYLADLDDYSGAIYTLGLGKCVSDNGIVLGGANDAAQYWKDGEWYDLEIPEDASETNLANAITPDGKRICGSIGVSGISLDGYALMQAPCIWNATADGYGKPVMLPHPEKDFTGRVPQYITAVDIASDGKTIIGQVHDAFGYISYPIIYKEDENGEWSYEIPHENLLNVTNVKIPEYPGDGPAYVSYEQYMTPEELDAYNAAVTACWESGFELPYPDFLDYMSEENKAAYEEASKEYEAKQLEWDKKYEAWAEAYQTCIDYAPGYEFNSIRISPDGKTYANTTVKEDYSDPMSWRPKAICNVWVFDVNSDKITKYNSMDDLNLTCLANDGVVLAANSFGNATQSYVLQNGMIYTMFYWMAKKSIDYAAWMKENMTFSYETYEEDPETGDLNFVMKDEFMTGRAVATPDLSIMCLSVQNIWDYMTDGNAYVFDVKTAYEAGVNTVAPADNEKVIYDLSGRRLKSATAPGIYIINGEKKIVK